MAYVYCHFKADTNEPFYVGIGKKITRAHALNHHSRTKFHQNIVKKHGVNVSIISEVEGWDVACFWEKAWIKALRNNNYKIANLTDGGDGTLGLDAHNKKSVLCLETGKLFNSATEAAKEFDLSVAGITDVCRNKYRSIAGMHFIFSNNNISKIERNEIIKNIEIKSAERRKRVEKNKNFKTIVNGLDFIGRKANGPIKNSKRVICLDDLTIYPSASEAARQYNVAKSAVIELCLGKNNRKSVGGLKFKYVEESN